MSEQEEEWKDEDGSVRMAEFKEMNLVFYPSEAQTQARDKAYQKKLKAYRGGK
jgi:hypothetical protein